MRIAKAKKKNGKISNPHSSIALTDAPVPHKNLDSHDDHKYIEIGKSIALEHSTRSKEKKTFLRFLEDAERSRLALLENQSFYIFRTDNNQVLARGIEGFENAKQVATNLRKKHGLQWDQVRFKAERTQKKASKRPFGVSGDGRTFTNASGQTSRIDYSPRFNPSKGRRFRGYTDADGNYHDLD